MYILKPPQNYTMLLLLRNTAIKSSALPRRTFPILSQFRGMSYYESDNESPKGSVQYKLRGKVNIMINTRSTVILTLELRADNLLTLFVSKQRVVTAVTAVYRSIEKNILPKVHLTEATVAVVAT